MKTILVPVDFSGATASTLNFAKSYAQLLSAELVLFHVITTPTNYLVYPEFDGSPPPEEVVQTARESLGKLMEPIRREGVHVRAETAQGLAYEQIAQMAKRCGADLIIMGSHGHTAFYDLILGSTTGGVLKLAECPVVVIPARAIGNAPAFASAAQESISSGI